MKNKFYSRVAVMIMTVIWQMVSNTALAQRQVQVVEMQTQPDGTQIYVPKTIEVPEKSSEELAAAKSKAATVTAEEDDLQYFLNNLAMTRAGESTVVIDLSTFKDTIRQTTLQVNQGISLKFTNGAIRRGEGIAANDPIIRISNGTVVEFDATVTISGENLETNGSAVEMNDASLTTSAVVGNTRYGTENHYGWGILSRDSKLVVTGGKICSINYYNVSYGEPLYLSGGDMESLYSGSNIIISNEDVNIDYLVFNKNNTNIKLRTTFKHLYYHEDLPSGKDAIFDNYPIVEGIDGYQITKNDMDKIDANYYDRSAEKRVNYKKEIINNSVVLSKYLPKIQSDINNATDGIETTINLDDYGYIEKGLIIPSGKKIRIVGTKTNFTAWSFTDDFIFKTENNAQLDITIPNFTWRYDLPKYAFVASGSSSKIVINQYETDSLALDNTLLYTENGGAIDCYAKINTDSIYNSYGCNMNICSDSGKVNCVVSEEGSTTNITGTLSLCGTFIAEGTVSMRGGIISNLTNFVLGKNSLITFTTYISKTSLENLVASFKDNDYVLGKDYIHFLSGYDLIKFSLLDGHTPKLGSFNGEDGRNHSCISIVEYDKEKVDAELPAIKRNLLRIEEDLAECSKRLEETAIAIGENYSVGNLTSEDYEKLRKRCDAFHAELTKCCAEFNTISSFIEAGYYAEGDIWSLQVQIETVSVEIDEIQEGIASLQSDLDSILASHKKTFTNTDDLQDYLNSLAQNNETTPEAPAKVSVADGTELDNVEIPEGTHVEIDIEGDGGDGGESGDDLQAYLNGLVTVKEGGSLTLRGNYTLRGARTTTFTVYGVLDIYATIIVEGTREEVIYVYNGGTANWRGEMQGGKIVNEGELNHYSGSTDYIENRGTANHRGGVCHHVVNYKTYYLTGGTIDGSAAPYTCAFENHGTARLAGGTVIHRQTLIYIVKGATTYVDGSTLDDSNATTTVLAYDDFHIRGDYAPKSIVIDYGVCIHFITVWTVRWHITFIDNRTTIRKVIFHSDVFDVNDDYIKYIDFTLPDRYRWYYNVSDNGLEIRDDKVFDADDLQYFLDLLKTRPGTAADPIVLDGGSHTVPLPLDESGTFRFPGNTYIIVRDIIFRYVSPAAKRRWTVPSGSTVVLRDVTIDGGEGASNYEDADIFVDGGDLYIDNVVFVNIHLNITRTIYISSAVKSWIYIRYTKDGAPAAGDRIAEGAGTYYLTDSDAQWFRHIDYDGWQNLWQLRRNGNVIELYLSDPSGIGAVEADGNAKAYIDASGTLRLSGIPADESCSVFRTDGTLVVKGTAAELTARPVILSSGAYILRSRTATMKFIR